MKISNDLERVGDEASTICKRIININKHADWKVPLREIVAMKACLLLRKSMDAYVEHDSEKAQQLIPQDEDVDILNKMYQATDPIHDGQPAGYSHANAGGGDCEAYRARGRSRDQYR